MATIHLEYVSKTYAGAAPAVRDVSLAIGDGELVVLVGPSGSGKSTVLRLIAGLEEATAGRILIGGQDVTGVPPQQRDLAMVFQSYALYPHKSVRENLAFGLTVRGVAAAEIAARVQRTADMLGMAPLLDRRPAQLSGGQRQRVALGRALVREPRAFLLDEPLSNLDPRLRTETRAELALLHRRLRATMVYVTHDQEEAMTLGQRVAVMRDGAIEQVAAPLELFAAPVNTFVAGFIGSPAMNLWRGFEPPGGRLPAPRESLVVGIRPHEIRVTAPGAADAHLRAGVEVVEPLGAATVAYVRADGIEPLVRVLAPADVPLAVGDIVGLALRLDRLHYFDAATGGRL